MSNTIEIQVTEARVGQEVTVWGRGRSGYLDWGQGGKVVSVEGTTIAIRTPIETRTFDVADPETFPYGYGVTVEETQPASDCLNFGPDCRGEVDYRTPLSGTGRSFPRCERHWSERLRTQHRIVRRYGHPESASPPAGFDPAYAGESWDGE